MTTKERELEYEADRLLRQHGALGVKQGVYRECDLIRRTAKEILLGEDVPFIEAALFHTAPKVSLLELVEIAGLTVKQRQACRLMHRLGKQALVAHEMGVAASEVSRLLQRAYLRISEVRPLYDAEEPSAWGWRMFYEELAFKKSITYRKSTHPLDSSFHVMKKFSKKSLLKM